MLPLKFRPAMPADVVTITALVNSAYRGESSKAGWTSEADLIEGARIADDEVAALIAGDNSVVLLCVADGEIVGCVELQHDGLTGYLGLFVVRPTLQGAGIGKRFLAAAEAHARAAWQVSTMTMTVITERPELMAYYERRGYQRTGRFKPFPKNAGQNVPKIPGLRLEVLAKTLC